MESSRVNSKYFPSLMNFPVKLYICYRRRREFSRVLMLPFFPFLLNVFLPQGGKEKGFENILCSVYN